MVKYFDVYKSTKGYYVKEDVIRDFGINSNETKVIKNVIYYKVPEETIASIEETTKNEAVQYLRNELVLFDLQIVLTIKILVDKTSNKKYINQIHANKLNVIGNKRTIDSIVYVEITDSKIQEIVESSKNDTIVYNIAYEEVELESERKPAKNLFLYYNDIATNTLYITREILDLVRGLNIELDTTPKVVDNRNCYSITPEKLKEFENKSKDFRGVEKIIQIDEKKEDPSEIFDENNPVMPYNDEISTVTDENDPVIPYDDRLSKIFDENSVAFKIRDEVNKALKGFFNEKTYEPVIPYDDDLSTVVDEDLIPYDDDLSTVVDEDLIPYNDDISTIIDYKELEAIKHNVKIEFEKYLKKKLEDEDLIPYNDDISTIYDESVLANRILYEVNKAIKKSFYNDQKKTIAPTNNNQPSIKNIVETVLVYKDIRTGKLYIPEENAKTKYNLETILNKRCYETSFEELESIYNKRFLIIGVAIRPKQQINIVICNNDGDLFISNDILKHFNIVSNYSKMILVNKEIFTQIGNEELDKLEKIDLDNTIVNIEIKKIVKVNK